MLLGYSCSTWITLRLCLYTGVLQRWGKHNEFVFLLCYTSVKKYTGLVFFFSVSRVRQCAGHCRWCCWWYCVCWTCSSFHLEAVDISPWPTWVCQIWERTTECQVGHSKSFPIFFIVWHLLLNVFLIKVATDMLSALEGGAVFVLTLTYLLHLTLSTALCSFKDFTSSGISGPVLAWFNFYLTDRTQIVIVDCQTECPAPLSCGVSQGSVLGPILLILYTKPLLSSIQSHYISHYFFLSIA